MGKPNSEKTSSAVASKAGRLLASDKLKAAEAWLTEVAVGSSANAGHAAVVLASLAEAKSIAASALTQRADRD